MPTNIPSKHELRASQIIKTQYCRVMNVVEAKHVPLESIMDKLGHHPTRVDGDTIWYRSPFRDETNASFNISRRKNLYYDWGAGSGGSPIDLVMAVYQLTSVSDALRTMDDLLGSQIPSVPRVAEQQTIKHAIEIQHVGPVKSNALLAYLRQRGINPVSVKSLVHEIRYKIGDKHYFALGFANDSGSFELRNPYFKGSTGKDITTIQGRGDRVICFEGFFDYLSAISMSLTPAGATVIVLNSTAMKQAAIDKIRQLSPNTVDLYRDNDDSGKVLLRFFQDSLPGIVIDRANCYAGFNDLNESHAANKHATTSVRR